MFIWIIFVFSVLFIFLFRFFLSQSKKPSGITGVLMMNLWNTVYLPLVKWSMSKIKINDGTTILDIGVGNGASSDFLLQQAHSLSLIGIDFSEAAITQAKKKYSNKQIQFELMDVHCLTFDSECFDFVTAFQTHFHWTDLHQAIHEIHRVLKPNGIAVFACETAKINYFLPELKRTADFQAKMSGFGFVLVDHYGTAKWSLFTFKKIK